MAAMELHGARPSHGDGGGGVKVKFIETQFVSSDAASFKSVVQRLTGKSTPALAPPSPAPVPLHRPRARAPCPAAAAAGGGWVEQGGRCVVPTVALPAHHAVPPRSLPSPRLEELHELCDFADLLYATAGAARRDGGSNGFPY